MLKKYLNNFSQAFSLQWLPMDPSAKHGSCWMFLESLYQDNRLRPLQSWEYMGFAPTKRHRMSKVKGKQKMETAAAKFTMQSKNYFPINPVRRKSLRIKASDVCSFLLLTCCVSGCKHET